MLYTTLHRYVQKALTVPTPKIDLRNNDKNGSFDNFYIQNYSIFEREINIVVEVHKHQFNRTYSTLLYTPIMTS